MAHQAALAHGGGGLLELGAGARGKLQALAARQLLAKSADEVVALAGRATGPEALKPTNSVYERGG